MTAEQTNRRLVIVTDIQLDFYHHVTEKMVAARFPKLHLTAYGDTEGSAKHDFKKLFNTFVHVLRERGLLEDRLNKAGVNWLWADECSGDLPEYEDTNQLRDPPKGVRGTALPGASWLPSEARDPPLAAAA